MGCFSMLKLHCKVLSEDCRLQSAVCSPTLLQTAESRLQTAVACRVQSPHLPPASGLSDNVNRAVTPRSHLSSPQQSQTDT